MENGCRFEQVGPQSLERLPSERVGLWAERLLVHVINSTGTGRAERATRDEDRHGVDIWIKVKGRKKAIPVDLTLLKIGLSPHLVDGLGNEEIRSKLEEKRTNARETGYVVFEAANGYGITLGDLEKAARGGRRYQEKVIAALDESITDWARKLTRPFITREELAGIIEREEQQKQQRRGQQTPRRGKGYYRRRKERQRSNKEEPKGSE